jgi:hypothetical protein
VGPLAREGSRPCHGRVVEAANPLPLAAVLRGELDEEVRRRIKFRNRALDLIDITVLPRGDLPSVFACGFRPPSGSVPLGGFVFVERSGQPITDVQRKYLSALAAKAGEPISEEDLDRLTTAEASERIYELQK